ncbi:hypothetical protein NSK_004152 [Nannochloropsis salina CCMP1776]|uniref:Uncharacterized protein n=1 Tax=Nannochloropsis salina CCMP1776 TaxID=1027361 RepID=A0A4D9D7S1_9STRA|nr:hypothetical protein NSK_004152 [Nannochloropsis salina CCMP1776]|eukprot:TFJ84688.1 hypothetical protein NSK_004152 [Nannochloropsis salina CCMP1776]
MVVPQDKQGPRRRRRGPGSSPTRTITLYTALLLLGGVEGSEMHDFCPVRIAPLSARGWGSGGGAGGRGRGNGFNDDEDDNDEIAREVSVLEAEQARIMAELEAARLKAQLAKLQQEQAGRGGGGREGNEFAACRDREGDGKAGWGKGREGGREGKGGALTDPEKEARYTEVVEELVNALQDVSQEAGVDFKTIVRGLKASRGEGGGEGGLGFPSSGESALKKSVWDERQVLEAMRKGAGNALVKRMIDGTSEGEEEGDAGGLARLAAWGSLVEKTISSSKYMLTAEKVLGMKHLADRLLPPEIFHGGDITVAHLAVIRAVTQNIADEYPEVRRRRGNMLYVLLNLPWASRGLGQVHQHAEEVAVGAGISMESSLGLGCRGVFESTLADSLPGSAEALSLMEPEAFRATMRALGEFGGLARQLLGLTRMSTEEALKGASFYLVPWLRRVAKRALEGGGEGGGEGGTGWGGGGESEGRRGPFADGDGAGPGRGGEFGRTSGFIGQRRLGGL